MYEPITKPTAVSVNAFLKKVADPRQREDSFVILKMMKDITGLEPRMWGPSMIGFGDYHYKYASGHEGDCFQIGFSPRKGQMSLYLAPQAAGFEALLKKLGKHKMSKACLYVKRLSDVDQTVLRELMEISFAHTAKRETQNKRAPAKKTRAKK
jgi:hypothetical protein